MASLQDRYTALGQWLAKYLALEKTAHVAVQDEFGLWHSKLYGVSACLPKEFQAIKSIPRAAIAIKSTACRIRRADREFFCAKLEAVDFYYRLRRQAVRHEAEKRQLMLSSKSARKKIFSRAERRVALFNSYAHDLKTPLSMLTIPLEQLAIKDDSVPARLRLQLEKIRTAIYSVLRTVTHSLDAARLLSRKTKPFLLPYDLSAFVKQVVDVYSIVFESYGINLRLELENQVICEIDPIQFEKVLNNILSNAIKYNMPSSTVTITLCSADGKARLSIADNGLGSDLSLAKKTINPWAISSHGYGLSIVRELVRLNRGTIHVASRPGSGTTVTISLACVPELAAAAQARRLHNFDFTLHEVELMAAERNALSRRRPSENSKKV